MNKKSKLDLLEEQKRLILMMFQIVREQEEGDTDFLLDQLNRINQEIEEEKRNQTKK